MLKVNGTLLLLLEFTDKGIYCPQVDMYIDPWLPVDKAIITHAHSDHAKFGCKYYLSHHFSAPVLRLRLGSDINLETLSYGEKIHKNGVSISLHPAGHIIGSAQVRLEYKGEIWVVSGDYKTENDGISDAFEPVQCNTFITECTFGLPVFQWKDQHLIYAEINEWWKTNKEQGKASVLLGYSLGKAQRLLFHLDQSIGKIFAHGAVWNTTEALRSVKEMPQLTRVTNEISKNEYAGSIILAPSSSVQTPWIRKFMPFSTANVSGWMALRGAKRRRPIDRGFVLSDHADWQGLLGAIKDTGAEKIYATHGYKSSFSRHLRELGYDAQEVETMWEGEIVEETVPGESGFTIEPKEITGSNKENSQGS